MNDTTGDTMTMTYEELAAKRGISKASARRLTFRLGWRRTMGNDGKARVSVPVGAMTDTNDDPTDPVATATNAITPRAPTNTALSALMTSPGAPTAMALFALRTELMGAFATMTANVKSLTDGLKQERGALEAERSLRGALTRELADTHVRLVEMTTKAEQAEHRATQAEADRDALQAQLRALHAELSGKPQGTVGTRGSLGVREWLARLVNRN
jgi:hypothetical protein